MRLYWWLRGKLTRRRRARQWAVGIRAQSDEMGLRWEVDNPSPEYATSASLRWDELSGVAECSDDGTVPEGIMVLRRGANAADFLPLAGEGVRAILEAAHRRGLVRPVTDLVTERLANAKSRPPGA
jgi:hypothetical protein